MSRHHPEAGRRAKAGDRPEASGQTEAGSHAKNDSRPETSRRPKVCLVQYNASRFLMRVDRSARTLAADGWEVVLVAIKDAETPAFEDRGDYVVKRVDLLSRRLPRWTRPLRFFEAIGKTFWAAYREDADVYNPRDIYPVSYTHLTLPTIYSV